MANVGELMATIAIGGMDEVERQLKKFSDSMQGASDKISKIGDGFKKAGDSISGVGQNLLPITAGLGAVGAAGVAASENINTAMNGFKTGLGATGKELEALGDSMEQVASTGVGSFEEISQAMVGVTQNMGDLKGAELETVTEQAMQLANVLEEDVSAVTRSAGTMMKQFGIDSGTAMDLLAKGYQSNLNFSGEFLDSINEYSVHFQQLGFSAEDMFNIMINGAESGAFNLDKIGDSIKEGGLRMKDLSDGSAEAFETLGLDAATMFNDFNSGGEKAKMAFMTIAGALSNVSDESQKTALGTALFGTTYEDLGKQAVDSFASIEDKLGDYGGTAAQIAEDNKTFSQVMAGAWNDLQVAIKPVGDVLINVASTVLPPLMAGVKAVAGAFAALPQPVQFAVVAVGALVAVLPLVLIAFGAVLSAVGSIVTGFGALTGAFSGISSMAGLVVGGFTKIMGAFKALTMLFMTNPFMLLAVAVVAVIALIVIYWDEFKAFFVALFEAIGAFLAPFWEGVKTLFGEVVEFLKGLWEGFKVAFEAVFNAVKAVVETVINILKAVFMAYITYIQVQILIIKTVFETVFNAVKVVVETVINVLKTIFNAYVNAVSIYLNTIKTLFTTIWNFISNNIVKPVVEGIKKVIQGIVNTVTTVTNNVKNVFSTAFNTVRNLVGGAIDGIVSKVTGIWNTAKEVADKIKGAFSNLFGSIKIPKFSFEGSLNPVKWATEGMPKVKVQWNAKGGILDDATLIGAGEKGAEAIVPLSSQRRMQPFAQAITKYMPEQDSGGSVSINIEKMDVRDEQDIRKVSQELYKLIQRDKRAGGFR